MRKLGRTGWLVSELGFGCYRVDDETPGHRKALETALARGCNLIDTSTNYTDGGSERLVGQVLKSAKRDEVLVVSKVGYVQGQNLDLAEKRDAEKRPFPEMVRYMDGCWHCIHPEFIEDQLTRSLERLQLCQLDVYLLHNPEYFFSDAKKKRDTRSPDQLRDEFYRRIANAFAHLEKEVERGRIRAYGVSSNSFGSPESDSEMTSVSRMWEIAQKVRPEGHHFSVVQLPMNLFESGPVLEANNHGRTTLQFAQEKDLGVLVNRPINAIVHNQMIRLADFRKKAAVPEVSEQLGVVRVIEDLFEKEIAGSIQTGASSVSAKDFFRWALELAPLEQEPIALEQWSQFESQILNQTQALVRQLNAYFGSDGQAWVQWRSRYVPELERLLAAFYNRSAERSQKTSATLSKHLDKFLPEALHAESFSRKALAALVATPGVSCVLNGMRRDEYVEDSMGVLGLPPFAATEELYQAFRKHWD